MLPAGAIEDASGAGAVQRESVGRRDGADLRGRVCDVADPCPLHLAVRITSVPAWILGSSPRMTKVEM